MLTIYGLKNCDTCRKARSWLKERGIDHEFHDVRADGITSADVQRWADTAGWEKLLNRRGTTWRGLSDTDKEAVDEAKAVSLMSENPALIKRPVFEQAGKVVVGFTADDQQDVSRLVDG